MTRAIALLLVVGLSGCVAPEAPGPARAARRPLNVSVAPTGQASGPLIGLTAPQLVGALGTPRQEAFELDARRLQWANGRCVLDAYLSAAGRGERRTTYLDARTPMGEPVDAAACAALLRVR